MGRPEPVIREEPPCKGCVERKKGCHDVCEKYKNWKGLIEQVKSERKRHEIRRGKWWGC